MLLTTAAEIVQSDREPARHDFDPGALGRGSEAELEDTRFG
ncbi:hypothetical protein [Nannocystis pusilla]